MNPVKQIEDIVAKYTDSYDHPFIQSEDLTAILRLVDEYHLDQDELSDIHPWLDPSQGGYDLFKDHKEAGKESALTRIFNIIRDPATTDSEGVSYLSRAQTDEIRELVAAFSLTQADLDTVDTRPSFLDPNKGGYGFASKLDPNTYAPKNESLEDDIAAGDAHYESGREAREESDPEMDTIEAGLENIRHLLQGELTDDDVNTIYRMMKEYPFDDATKEQIEKHLAAKGSSLMLEAWYDEWFAVKRKQVPDADGFYTDYSMYKNHNSNDYIFIFGDRDMYNPGNTDPDFETDSKAEAYEWFNSYEGFTDIEEKLKESQELVEELTRMEFVSEEEARDYAEENDKFIDKGFWTKYSFIAYLKDKMEEEYNILTEAVTDAPTKEELDSIVAKLDLLIDTMEGLSSEDKALLNRAATILDRFCNVSMEEDFIKYDDSGDYTESKYLKLINSAETLSDLTAVEADIKSAYADKKIGQRVYAGLMERIKSATNDFDSLVEEQVVVTTETEEKVDENKCPDCGMDMITDASGKHCPKCSKEEDLDEDFQGDIEGYSVLEEADDSFVDANTQALNESLNVNDEFDTDDIDMDFVDGIANLIK